MTIPDAELLLIESKLLALRKIADQGLLLVEQIKKCPSGALTTYMNADKKDA